MRRPLLPLLAVASATLLLPLVGAVVGGQPLGDLIRFPLAARAWDVAAHDAAYTQAAYLLTAVTLLLLVWLAWPRRPRPRAADRSPRRSRWPRFVWLAPLALIAAVIAIDGAAGNAATGLITLALILFVNADTERRTGHSLISQRRGYFLALFPASVAAGWLYFYWINLFFGLWTYPDAHDPVAFALGKSIDYATLLPALLSLRHWLASFPPLLAATNRGLEVGGGEPDPQEGWLLLGIAALALAASPVWPDGLYPLAVAAPAALALGIQLLRRETTSLVGLKRGDWSRPLLSALAALLLIALGQTLNLLIGPIWSYQLPLLAGPTLLELPLPAWMTALPAALLGLWLADQLTDPFRQRPQQPPFRPRAPVQVPVVDLLRDKDRR